MVERSDWIRWRAVFALSSDEGDAGRPLSFVTWASMSAFALHASFFALSADEPPPPQPAAAARAATTVTTAAVERSHVGKSRDIWQDTAPSGAVEHLLLLSIELLVGQDALVAQRRKLLQALDRRVRDSRGRGLRGSRGRSFLILGPRISGSRHLLARHVSGASDHGSAQERSSSSQHGSLSFPAHGHAAFPLRHRPDRMSGQ